jgi:hypothetical protein
MAENTINLTEAHADSAQPPKYEVVMRAAKGPFNGVLTRSSFRDEAGFQAWLDRPLQKSPGVPMSGKPVIRMRDYYVIVAAGVTDAEAEALVCTPANDLATAATMHLQLTELIKRTQGHICQLVPE